MRTFQRTMIAAIAIPALILGAVACSDDDPAESGTNVSQESIDTLTSRVQRNEQMFAVISISKLGLHDMDEGLNETGEIDSSYAPNTRTAIRLLALTNWGEHQADADAVRGHAEDLATALADEDVAAAAAAAAELHESEHDFSKSIWNDVAADLPAAFGGPEPDHDDEAETPTADETPEEDHNEDETPEAEGTP